VFPQTKNKKILAKIPTTTKKKKTVMLVVETRTRLRTAHQIVYTELKKHTLKLTSFQKPV